MKKTPIWILLVTSLTLLALTGCGLLQDTTAPSAPIEAIPLEPTAGAVEVAPTDAPPTAEPAATEAPVVEPAATEAAEAAPTEEPAAAPASQPRIFTIDQAGSQVRFVLDEDLRGVRTTVTGVTDQVAGEMELDLANLSSARVGVIQINARTLLTDNNFRNRAIQNEILDTDQFEFITFTPTAVDGLPASVAVGEPVQFTITGDLAIRDVTLPVTFTVEATAVSESQITGTASAVVNRADYGLQIPSVPSVANVEEEVDLIIDFTANGS